MPESGPPLNYHVTDRVGAVAPNFNMSKFNMSTCNMPKINVSKFNISRPIVNLIINGSNRSVFLDSGATLSLIQQGCVNNNNIRPLSKDIRVYDVNGQPLKYIGITLVALSPPSDSRIVHLVPCLVVSKEVNFNADMLLSCKDMSKFNGTLDLQSNELKGLNPRSPHKEWRVPLIIDNDTVTRGLHVNATSGVPCDDTRAIESSRNTTNLVSTEVSSHESSGRVDNVSSLKDFLAHERSGASKSFVNQSTKNGRRIIERNMKINKIKKLKAEALEKVKDNEQENSNKCKVNNKKKKNNNFVMYSEVGSSEAPVRGLSLHLQADTCFEPLTSQLIYARCKGPCGDYLIVNQTSDVQGILTASSLSPLKNKKIPVMCLNPNDHCIYATANTKIGVAFRHTENDENVFQLNCKYNEQMEHVLNQQIDTKHGVDSPKTTLPVTQNCDIENATTVSLGHLEQASGTDDHEYTGSEPDDLPHTLHAVHNEAPPSVLHDPASRVAAQLSHADSCAAAAAAHGAAGTVNTQFLTDQSHLGTVRRGTESSFLLKDSKLPRPIISSDITCPTEHVGKTLNILNNFRSAVALEGEPLGLTHLMKMHITLQDGAKPTYVRPYPMSHFNQRLADEAVTEMLEQKVIEPSISPFNAPLVLVKKKSGKVRPVIDYRRLNEVTVADKHPLPKISNILQHLARDTPLYDP